MPHIFGIGGGDHKILTCHIITPSNVHLITACLDLVCQSTGAYLHISLLQKRPVIVDSE
jgi:Flp pilus assembly protein protease CpaA